MDWLSTLTGETRARLLRLVRGAASSVAELAAAVGISENAVRTHLSGLERDGLVRQARVQRSTGGKPARLYELTPEAEELFPKAYALVLGEVVQVLRDEEGEEAALERMRRVGRRLGARGRAARGEAGGVEAAVAVLESIGGSVNVRQGCRGWTLEAEGCPLSGAVQTDPAVCVLAEALVAEVSGLPVEERCDRADRPRCAFHIGGGEAAEPAGGEQTVPVDEEQAAPDGD